jgi:hypothetical protein
MASKDLQRIWQVVRKHLEAAREQLPAELPRHLKCGPLLHYEDCLSHNELELAFDELEGIGHEVDCKQAFWSELLAAAENMSLPKHAERCRQRLAGG